MITVRDSLPWGPPVEVQVPSDPVYRHIDTDVYRFARRGLRRDIRLAGQKTSVLKHNNDCRNMVLPAGAQVGIGSYGLNSKELVDQGRNDYAARFRLGVRRMGTEEMTEVFEDVVDTSAETWRTQTLNLRKFALQRVALCIATEEVGGRRRHSHRGIRALATAGHRSVQVRGPVDGGGSVVDG